MRNRKKDKKKTPEETLIETANKMINECRQASSALYWDEATRLEPPTFFQSISGLSHRLETNFSPETLGEIGALGLGHSSSTDWRRTSMLDICGPGPRRDFDFDMVDGKMLLVRLARIVIAAAMYDILATRHTLSIEAGSVPRSTTYVPPKLLREYVRKVRRAHI
ncbi:MAG TPA: hypothetical protein VGE35_03050 [Candidatus Paceibacterota bacterium]